jgi:translation initiation factor 1
MKKYGKNISGGTDGQLVYATGSGRTCPECNQPIANCICLQLKNQTPATNGKITVGRETAGRKGKGVTTIKGLPLPSEQLANLAKELKQKCATGGSVVNGVIELQGEHRDTCVKLLTQKGYTPKKAGG